MSVRELCMLTTALSANNWSPTLHNLIKPSQEFDYRINCAPLKRTLQNCMYPHLNNNIHSELSAGGDKRDVQNCILARRSGLGPPSVGRHGSLWWWWWRWCEWWWWQQPVRGRQWDRGFHKQPRIGFANLLRSPPLRSPEINELRRIESRSRYQTIDFCF